MPGQEQRIPVNIEEEMKRSYLDYAMSVIIGRALPDVRDGFKPVHRRVLYAMHELGLTHRSPYKKSARVVGDCLGRYHPHGDQAVYDTIVRMVQDFSMRYPLIDGQGNFGSIDGDAPAAMRYCVTADTLVVTNQGLVPIGKLSDGSEDIHLRVLSLGGKVNVAGKWFDCGEHPTLRVTTRRGYEVTGTPNHPLLTWQPDSNGHPHFIWKTLDALQVGDWVVVDRSRDMLWPTTLVDLCSYHPDLRSNPRVQRHRLPERLDENLAFLLGALLAEGTVADHRIEFTNVPGEFTEKFSEAWTTVFPTCRLHRFLRQPVSFGKRPFLQLQVVAKEVCLFLNRLLFSARSAERVVPEVILRSPKPVIAAFLRAYFEGDGAVERSGRSLLWVSATSMSEKLLKQLQVLLLRFGIDSWRYHNRRGLWKLVIRGRENLQCFAEEIGFVSERKRQALHKVLTLSSGMVLSKTDFIPFLALFVRQTAVKHRQWLGKHNFDRYPRLAAALPYLDQAGLVESSFITFLLKQRYLFDQVVAVEDAGWHRVYSVRVESDCHSFWANGFINHNTEVRLAKIAQEMLKDIDKETVDFAPNFDGSLQEPKVLPAALPNLLVNGSSGIAVGMATNIPPHNLGEVVDALLMQLEDPEVPLERLLEVLPGPDFPTAGFIHGRNGIVEAYKTGRGLLILRAKAFVEKGRGGKESIIVSELPYQVNKAKLIERIAELIREKKIEGIVDLRDESDREGMRIVIELKKDEDPRPILNQLYKHTPMQSTFGVIMLALVDNQPRILTLKELLQHLLAHRREVVLRRTRFDLKRAEEKAHILEGYRIALNHLDAVVALIRGSRSAEEAKAGLMTRFGLTEVQAQAILDLKLQRLTQLERQKIQEEFRETLQAIERFQAILRSEALVKEIIKEELLALKDAYADPRRTEILEESAEIQVEDMLADEEMVITITHGGYIKRTPLDVYRAQKRGGKGMTGITTKEEDYVEHLFVATTLSYILLFTSMGKVHWLKVHEIPQLGRAAKGRAVVNLLQLGEGEKITTMIPIRQFEVDKYLLMATKRGIVKKTELSAFSNPRSGGIIAITLDEGDELIAVGLTKGDDEAFLGTKNGMAIRFKEEDVRPMGRAARGVIGISLEEGDEVVGMEVVSEGAAILTVTEKGYGKRTALGEYRLQGRGGKGIINVKVTEKTGSVVGVMQVLPEDEFMMITQEGKVARLRVGEVRLLGRATQGVRLQGLDPGDQVAAITRVVAEEE